MYMVLWPRTIYIHSSEELGSSGKMATRTKMNLPDMLNHYHSWLKCGPTTRYHTCWLKYCSALVEVSLGTRD